MKDGQFDVQSTESARSMTDESTEIPSYLNIKEIKIELKAFLSNKYVREKAGTCNSSKGIHSC